jgi:WD40 repeat protein
MNVNAAAPLSNLPPPTPSRQVRSFDVSAADVMVLAYSDGSLDTAQLPFAAPRRIGKLQTAYEKVRWSPAAPYRLACALADGVVVTWTPVAAAAGGLEEYSPQMLRGHALEVKDVSWSPDGTRLASVSLDSTIRIWDPANAAQPVVMSKPLDGWGQVVAWDPVPSSRFVAVVVNEDLAVLRASDLSLVAKRVRGGLMEWAGG